MTKQNIFTIRYATPADAELLTGLAARTFYAAFAATNTPENMLAYMSEAFTVARVTAELADPLATFFIAELAGAPAGYAKLHSGLAPDCVTGPRPIELARLYVERALWGVGLGATLMQACLDEARRGDFATIYLGVWERNPRAQAFYRKWGFARVGEHLFQMGDDPQTDWWMARPLDSLSENIPPRSHTKQHEERQSR